MSTNARRLPWWKRFLRGWIVSGASFNTGSPGPLGGTTSSTGQFTRLAVGASVPALPANAGDASILNSLGVGVAADGIASHIQLGNGAQILTSTGSITFAPNNNIINMGANQVSNIARTNFGGSDGGVNGAARFNPQTFASLPAAAAGNAGCVACVSDSTTVVWGATITGLGTHTVLAFSDGANWTVAAI